MVEKFNNSKDPRFSDMSVMVNGADLDLSVSCSITIWVCAACQVLVWIWLLLGAVRSVAILLLVSSYDVCGQLSHVRILVALGSGPICGCTPAGIFL